MAQVQKPAQHVLASYLLPVCHLRLMLWAKISWNVKKEQRQERTNLWSSTRLTQLMNPVSLWSCRARLRARIQPKSVFYDFVLLSLLQGSFISSRFPANLMKSPLCFIVRNKRIRWFSKSLLFRDPASQASPLCLCGVGMNSLPCSKPLFIFPLAENRYLFC